MGKVMHGQVRDAVYVGAVGARMEKDGVMELQECQINEKSCPGIITPWVMEAFAKFYGKQRLPDDISGTGVIRIRDIIARTNISCYSRLMKAF